MMAQLKKHKLHFIATAINIDRYIEPLQTLSLQRMVALTMIISIIIKT
jgi:hypothetical protein